MTDKPRTPAVEAFWAAYRAHAGVDHNRYDVIAHGDTPALQIELAELILAGPKRATASLARRYAGPGQPPLPRPGDHVSWWWTARIGPGASGRPRRPW